MTTSATTASNPGAYAIGLGSLSAGSNYVIDYVGASLTVLSSGNVALSNPSLYADNVTPPASAGPIVSISISPDAVPFKGGAQGGGGIGPGLPASSFAGATDFTSSDAAANSNSPFLADCGRKLLASPLSEYRAASVDGLARGAASAAIEANHLRAFMRRDHGIFAVAMAAACAIGLAGAPAAAQSEKEPPAAGSSDAAKKKDAAKKPEAGLKGDSASKTELPGVSSDPQVTTASFGDWVERCQRVASGEDTFRICEAAETFQVEGQSAPIAQLAIGRIKRSDPLRLTLVLPVNTAFPSAPKISVDGKPAESIELAWRRCIPSGCIADAVLSDDMVAQWRNEKSPGHIQSKNGAGQTFSFALSFRGLGPAYDALSKESSGS